MGKCAFGIGDIFGRGKAGAGVVGGENGRKSDWDMPVQSSPTVSLHTALIVHSVVIKIAFQPKLPAF